MDDQNSPCGFHLFITGPPPDGRCYLCDALGTLYLPRGGETSISEDSEVLDDVQGDVSLVGVHDRPLGLDDMSGVGDPLGQDEAHEIPIEPVGGVQLELDIG